MTSKYLLFVEIVVDEREEVKLYKKPVYMGYMGNRQLRKRR